MKLRPYQQTSINKCVEALVEHKNTLAVAPTGAGKTVIIAKVVDEFLKKTGNKKRVLVLVHRTKINFQNQGTFQKICGRKTSFFISGSIILSGQVVFGMIQTVAGYIDKLPPFDLIIIDEGHHARADTYDDLINDQKKKNPDLAIMAITATPNRGDKKGLATHFTNIAFQIKLEELIKLGYLVKPKAKVFDCFIKKERNLVSNSRHWTKTAKLLADELWENKRKKIIIFVSGIGHLQYLEEYLNERNIKTVGIASTYSNETLRENLREFEEGEARALINIDIATEGYDYPPIDCVVLMRAIGNKSMLLQMVGRGLRIVDKIKYPDCFKQDCLVLDFGINFEIFGDLEQEVDLVGKEKRPALLELKPEPEESDKKEPIGILPAFIYQIDLFKLGHFETFNYNDTYIKGLCGLNKSLFIIDDEKIFYKDGEKVKQIESKEELEGLAEILKNDNTGFFDKIKEQQITDFQCSVLIKNFDIAGCSRYRASVMISYLMGKDSFK